MTIKEQVLNHVEKTNGLTWKQIHTFILKLKGFDPNDKANRGRYSSYFSGHSSRISQMLGDGETVETRTADSHGLLLRPTQKDPRYLDKVGNLYVVKKFEKK